MPRLSMHKGMQHNINGIPNQALQLSWKEVLSWTTFVGNSLLKIKHQQLLSGADVATSSAFFCNTSKGHVNANTQ